MEVELMGIWAGRRYVNSFMEGEIDEHDDGRLRMLEKIWNRFLVRKHKGGVRCKQVCFITVNTS